MYVWMDGWIDGCTYTYTNECAACLDAICRERSVLTDTTHTYVHCCIYIYTCVLPKRRRERVCMYIQSHGGEDTFDRRAVYVVGCRRRGRYGYRETRGSE